MRPGHSTKETGHAQTKHRGACWGHMSQRHTQAAALAEFTAKHLKTKEQKPGQSRDLFSFGKTFRDATF